MVDIAEAGRRNKLINLYSKQQDCAVPFTEKVGTLQIQLIQFRVVHPADLETC